MSEDKEYRKYADMKSKLTSLMTSFWKICVEQERDPEDEIEDCIVDIKP